MTSVTHRQRRALVGLVLFLALALTGCGAAGSSGAAPVVASIPTSTAASPDQDASPRSDPASGTASSSERPLLRDDASDEERVRLAGIYIDCLVGAGLSPRMVAKGRDYAYPDRTMLTSKEIATCGSKEPELPFQRAMRTDPAFADHVHADVACLVAHGIPAIVQKDGDVGLENGLPGGDRSHWLQDCENQAFASFYATLPSA